MQELLRLRSEGEPPTHIERKTARRWPHAVPVVNRLQQLDPQILRYQAYVLWALAAQYNQYGARLLDIGTGGGFSAALLAEACPKAEQIVTITPSLPEAAQASIRLSAYANVYVKPVSSVDYLGQYEAGIQNGALSLIFIDGDHKHATQDLPWWNRLIPGTLMVFHDYTEQGSPHVVRAVEALSRVLHRTPGIRIVDARGIGLAGFYVQLGDRKWRPEDG